MQYLAPATCLLIGAGSGAFLSRISDPRRAIRSLRISLIALAMVGIVPTAAEFWHPFRSVHSDQARRFAKAFWPEVAQDAEVACLRWDLGVDRWDTIDLDVAVYLCNQAIYGPHRRLTGDPLRTSVETGRPLRVVQALPENVETMPTWLGHLQQSHVLRSRKTHVVDMSGGLAAQPRPERYEVFEFAPRSPNARGTSPRSSTSAFGAVGATRGSRR